MLWAWMQVCLFLSVFHQEIIPYRAAQAVLVPESPSSFWQNLRGPQKNTKKQTNWTNMLEPWRVVDVGVYD